MTRFETRGVEFQQEAITKEQAQKSFSYSCSCCNARGMRIDCDSCAIRFTHEMVMASLATEAEMADRIQNYNGRRGRHERQNKIADRQKELQ